MHQLIADRWRVTPLNVETLGVRPNDLVEENALLLLRTTNEVNGVFGQLGSELLAEPGLATPLITLSSGSALFFDLF